MKKLIGILILLLLVGVVININNDNQNNQKEVVEKTENKDSAFDRQILILQEDNNDTAKLLATTINEKMLSDHHLISEINNLDINDYDLIIITIVVLNNNIDNTIQESLKSFDFKNKDVSLLFVGSDEISLLESQASTYINNANILPGLGLTSEDVNNLETMNQFIDGWLTSIY
ncbi:MAG TPA: hypothetical protein H9980_08360 [Candidatus Erysipelatoclostridium merdavium]|uniref:Uncharacterized protein n=1 Tax=Candidatus Erysipelatoclostridium merdavium TaxID=2838566 RepID=A0A9D1XQ48_9FIRM|nr:hypothetical protein [Candidatus Erysipelatoclostridium merdavium]